MFFSIEDLLVDICVALGKRVPKVGILSVILAADAVESGSLYWGGLMCVYVIVAVEWSGQDRRFSSRPA